MQMRFSRSLALLVAGIMAALAGLVGTAIYVAIDSRDGGGESISASEIIDRASARTASRGEPGQIIHVKTRTFTRYGPARERIMAIPGTGPETTIRDSWSLIGDDGLAEKSYGQTSDPNGQVLFTTLTDRSGSEIRDVNGTIIQRFEFPPGYMPRDVSQENLQRFEGAAERGARLVGESRVDGLPTYTVEWEVSQLPSTGNEDGITVPYVADLDATGILVRIQIDQQSYRPLITEHFAIQEGEASVLLLAQEVLVYEDVSFSDLPESVAQALAP